MDIDPRNLAIYEDVTQRGLSTSEAASKYGLTARRIRDIRSEVAAYQGSAGSSNGAGKMGEIGVSGLDHTYGYINEEFLTDLNTSAKRYKQFNEMRQNSPIASSTLLAVELAIRRIEWRLEGDEDDERVEFVQECMDDMSHSWNDFISEVLTMLAFGWSFFEIVYKRRAGPLTDPASKFSDGRIGWRKFAFRSQDSLDRWLFDERGGLQGMVQRTAPDWLEHTIPMEKALLFRTTREKGNPEGRSLLRAAYVPYYYAKNMQAIEAIGVERDLAGLPVIYMGKGTDRSEGSADHTKAKQIVRRIRNDEQAGVVIPNPKNDAEGWGFELLGSPGNKQFSVDTVIQRYEKRISLTILAQFLMLGMDKVGSYSLGSDMTDFFLMACGAFADVIAETFNQHAIPRLLRLNGMSLEEMPQLAHGPIGTPDLEQIANYFSALGNAGFIQPDNELEQFLRRHVNAPEITEEMIAEREAQEESARLARAEAMARLAQAGMAQQQGQDEEEEADGKQPGSKQPNGKRPPPRQMSLFGQPDAPPRLKWHEDAMVRVDGLNDERTTEEVIDLTLDYLKRAGVRLDFKKLREAELGKAA